MKSATLFTLIALFAAVGFAESVPPPTATALQSCYTQGTVQYCNVLPTGGEMAVATATPGQALPTSYHDCHSHGGGVYCIGSDGEEVFMLALSSDTQSKEAKEVFTPALSSSTQFEEAKEDTSGCHYHGGVLHCPGSFSGSAAPACTQMQREYSIPRRIGSIFGVIITSAVSVFLPLVLRKRLSTSGVIFSGIRQFGTGIIIATAFIHLLTHSQLMFSDPCLGELAYEATASAVAMASAFVVFFLEYVAGRIISHRRRPIPEPLMLPASSSSSSQSRPKDVVHPHPHHYPGEEGDMLSLATLEIGILFHSILIGLTLIMSPDSHFLTMFVVIVFHQSFEGLALGAHLAATISISTRVTYILAAAFTVITPIGMAIGLGVRNSFNGNDRATLLAMATLNAVSAGVLVWVGCVEMWAGDWVRGDMASAGKLKATVGMVALCAGMAVMAALGKWA